MILCICFLQNLPSVSFLQSFLYPTEMKSHDMSGFQVNYFAPGRKFLSSEHEGNGTVFIRTLADQIKKNPSASLTTTMTTTVGKIEEEIENSDNEEAKKWLKKSETLPYCINQLRKNLCFPANE